MVIELELVLEWEDGTCLLGEVILEVGLVLDWGSCLSKGW